jgi:glutaminase
LLSGSHAKRINAVMLTCGTYDAAVEFPDGLSAGLAALDAFTTRTGWSIF